MTNMDSLKSKPENCQVKENSQVKENAQVKENLKENITLEDALTLTGVGWYSYMLFLISTYNLLAASAEIFGIGLIITSSQCDLDLDVYKKGLISSLPMLGIISSAHFWGYIADTTGRKFTLHLTLGGACLAAVASSFSNHWIALAALKYLSAMFASGTNAVMYALLGESTPQSHRARFLMYAGTGVVWSQGMIAVVAFPILRLSFNFEIPLVGFNYRPWRLLTQAYGIANAIGLLLVIFLLHESPKFFMTQGENEKGIAVLRNIYSTNTKKDKETFPVKSIEFEEDISNKEKQNLFKSIWNQTAPLLQKKYLKHTVLVSYLCVLVYSVAPPIIIWFPAILNTYFRSSTDVNNKTFCEILQTTSKTVVPGNVTDMICDDSVDELALAGMAIFGTYICIISALVVPISSKIGKKYVFIITHIISGLCAFLINQIYGIGCILALYVMISNALCIGIATAFAVELFPTYLRAMAVCLTIMVGRGISFIIINITGSQLETNCNNFFYGFGVFLFSGVVVGAFLPSDKKYDKKSSIEENP